MNYSILIFTLLVILIVLSVINTAIVTRRQIIFNNINMLYDKLELYVVQNKINPDNDVLSYLGHFKQFKINNELADIQVLISILVTKDKNTIRNSIKRYQEIVRGLPIELVQIGNKIDKEVSNAIKISFLKPDFMLFAISVFAKGICLSIFRLSITSTVKVVDALVTGIADAMRKEGDIAFINSRFA